MNTETQTQQEQNIQDLNAHMAVGFSGHDVVGLANNIETELALFNTLLRYQYAAKELEKK